GGTTHERHIETLFVDVVGVVGRRQHFGLVDVVHTERLQYLRLDHVSDTSLRHHRDGYRVDDLCDQFRVTHPHHSPFGANIGRNSFQRHDGHGPGILGDLRLLGSDNVHDHTAGEGLTPPTMHV